MDDELLKQIMYTAHLKALSKSHDKEDLKAEASKYEPMRMMWVWHVQTIVKEIIKEYNLTK